MREKVSPVVTRPTALLIVVAVSGDLTGGVTNTQHYLSSSLEVQTMEKLVFLIKIELGEDGHLWELRTGVENFNVCYFDEGFVHVEYQT